MRAMALLVAIVLSVAACGTSSEDSATQASSDDADAAIATTVAAEQFDDVAMEEEALEPTAGEIGADADVEPAEAAPESAALNGSGGVADGAPAQPIDLGRDIVFTASVAVEVEDVAAATQEATASIQSLGGIVFGQETTTEGIPRAILTFKVPPRDFQTALDRIGGVGSLRDQRITADDVTERVVDLESQIITAELSVERLRGFLEGATSLTDIAELERQLLDRETNLERLRGQLRTIQDAVSLATITVTLTEKVPGPELLLEVGGYRGHDDGATCPGFDELSLLEGEAFTVCYRVENVGDTLLAEINLIDDALGLDARDLTVVDGSLDEPLAVGASVVFAGELTAEPFTSSRAQVTAVAVDAEGERTLSGQTAAQANWPLEVEEDTSLPGFLSGLDAGIELLRTLASVVVLVSGFALPFIWLIPLLWLMRRWWVRRRETKRRLAAEAAEEARRRIPPPTASTPAPPVDPNAHATEADRAAADVTDEPAPGGPASA